MCTTHGFYTVLGVEPKTWHMVGRCATKWDTTLTPLDVFYIFRNFHVKNMGVLVYAILALSRSETGRQEIGASLDYTVRIYLKNEDGLSVKSTFLLLQRTWVQFPEPTSAPENLLSSSSPCRYTWTRPWTHTQKLNFLDHRWVPEDRKPLSPGV